MLAVELVRRGARQHADRTALVIGDRRVSFAEVDERANRVATALIGLGAGRGSRVGLLVNNGVWSAPLDFGCLKAGVARVPLNARLSLTEQIRMLADTGVRLLVHGDDLTERALQLADAVDGLRLAGLGTRARAGDLDLAAEADELTESPARGHRLPRVGDSVRVSRGSCQANAG